MISDQIRAEDRANVLRALLLKHRSAAWHNNCWCRVSHDLAWVCSSRYRVNMRYTLDILLVHCWSDTGVKSKLFGVILWNQRKCIWVRWERDLLPWGCKFQRVKIKRQDRVGLKFGLSSREDICSRLCTLAVCFRWFARDSSAHQFSPLKLFPLID